MSTPNNDFRRLRLFLAVAGVLGPGLLFVAFLCFTGGAMGWAVASVIIGLLLLFSFVPGAMRSQDTQSSPEGPLLRWAGLLAVVLIVMWVAAQPEVQALCQRLKSEGTGWDGHLLTAAGIWTAAAMVRNCRLLAKYRDEHILRWLEKSSASEVG